MITITKAEWMAKGTDLFGADFMNWRFVCPACKNVATVEDFKRYKDKGATPDSATCNCIGRYDGHMDVDMGKGKPCNYAGFGLLNLCPVTIKDEGKEISSFAFDEPGGGN